MLHVTNGDAAAPALRRGGVEGEILPWRDVLHDGPVPAGLDDAGLREVRARFLSDVGLAPYEQALADLAARDGALERGLAEGSVVLWFEHDLYDQLQLLQVLERIQRRGAAGPVRLVNPPAYIHALDSARVSHFLADTAELPGDALTLAARAWEAFRAPDLAGLLRMDLRHPALPHLAAARVRLCQELPGTADGLARTERQILQPLERTESLPLAELFPAATRDVEEPVWLGDASFALYVERLAGAPRPALRAVDDAPLRAPGPRDDRRAFFERRVALTSFGHLLLEGSADWVRENGLDRWLGGMRLRGHHAPLRSGPPDSPCLP